MPHPNEIQNKTYLDYEWKVSLHPSPNNFYLRTFVFYEGTKVLYEGINTFGSSYEK